MLMQFFEKNKLEAGCDEAGRGCLSGPVFAATVILPLDFSNDKLNDSKKLSEKDRAHLRKVIEKDAIAWAVAMVSPDEIDKINILRASFLAMHKAIECLEIKPETLLIDGNRFDPYKDIPFNCIVKGDSKYMSIAAASILAKTYRDDYMLDLHKQYPQYGWNKNKGYPTKAHRAAIITHGPSKHHRMSFSLLGNDDIQGTLF